MNPKFLKFDTVINPDTGRVLEYVDKKPCVAVLVTDHTKRQVLFVKQYRAGVQDYIYEAVAGVIEDGQTPIDAMYAELSQEVGVHKDDVAEVIECGNFYSSVGWTNEKAHLYVVVLKEGFTHKPQNLDTEESLTYEWHHTLTSQFTDMLKDTLPIKTAMLINYYSMFVHGWL